MYLAGIERHVLLWEACTNFAGWASSGITGKATYDCRSSHLLTAHIMPAAGRGCAHTSQLVVHLCLCCIWQVADAQVWMVAWQGIFRASCLHIRVCSPELAISTGCVRWCDVSDGVAFSQTIPLANICRPPLHGPLHVVWWCVRDGHRPQLQRGCLPSVAYLYILHHCTNMQ